ncbi:MAG TPA: rhomboid family intramembrane serine protease [Pseudomonadales bacterium]|nr:rhomboid family intramembrane serine protease [Pseudomonadales bacterium]
MALILANTAAFLYELMMPDRVENAFVASYALIPAHVTHVLAGAHPSLQSAALPFFTSMFLHGGWLHLIGNMWFLWIFGDNVEDAMGHVRFVAFYLLCGCAAAAAQTIADPTSTVPMVGASGAIGGVMGAYALLYPRAHVHMFIFLGFYMTTVAVPAIYMLGYWFLLQLVSGLPALANKQLGGVAFWAHVGGFVTGLAFAFVFRQSDRLATRASRPPRRTARHRWP